VCTVGQLDITQSSHGRDAFPYVVQGSSPPEVTMGSLHVKTYDETVQDQLRHEDIDLADEQRWQSTIKNALYR
jgi:hypothetical protein